MSASRRRAAFLLCLVSLSMSSDARQAPPSSAWSTVVVPGGATALLEAVGISPSIEEWRAIPAVIEHLYGGLRPRIPHAFREYPAHATGQDTRAPLPLASDFWARALKRTYAEREWLPAILATRAAASLYYALLCMDTDTLQAIAADPELQSLLIRRAELLPLQAKAVRIRRGRIDPAGGESFVPLWENLVGPLGRPAAFIDRLVSSDDGKLAYFYNTVDALSREAREFVAPTAESPESRLRNFKHLYAAFSSGMPTWKGGERRFFPIPEGPAWALFSLRITSVGSLIGPRPLAFWRHALAGGRVTDAGDSTPSAAADLLELLCPRGGCQSERIHTLMFVQRQVETDPAASASALEQAARTRLRFPALALELERLRLGDLAIYPAARSVAERIDDLPREHGRAALLQFQGAISLLRRLREAGATAEVVRTHLDDLFDISLSGEGYRGGLLRWFVSDVLDAANADDVDEAAIRALAGARSAGPEIEWEGVRYRVDAAATEVERLRSTTSRFGRRRLSQAWTLRETNDGRVDAAAAGAISALAYAVALQDPSTPLALSRELPDRHDLFTRVPGDPLPPSWTVPSVRLASRGVRHVGGALLALDAGVPELAGRRLGGDLPRERARISPVLADGLLRSAALVSLWADTSDEAERLAVAVERGTAVARGSSRLEAALARAGILGPRAGWIRWAIAQGPSDPTDPLRLEDLVRLGTLPTERGRIGAAAPPLAYLGLAFPEVTWEMRGQPPDHAVAASLAVEAPLRVALELRRRSLPPVLAHGVLSMLATDLIESSALAHPADLHGLADSVRRLPSHRFDDYIAAVTARGPLVPVSSGPRHDQ